MVMKAKASNVTFLPHSNPLPSLRESELTEAAQFVLKHCMFQHRHRSNSCPVLLSLSCLLGFCSIPTSSCQNPLCHNHNQAIALSLWVHHQRPGVNGGFCTCHKQFGSHISTNAHQECFQEYFVFALEDCDEFETEINEWNRALEADIQIVFLGKI